MELKDFIGKIVIHPQTNKRYKLYEITAPVIEVVAEKLADLGVCMIYRYPTINGDPISTGALVFEDAALTAPFKAAYDAHCLSEDGRWEEYDYWMRRS